MLASEKSNSELLSSIRLGNTTMHSIDESEYYPTMSIVYDIRKKILVGYSTYVEFGSGYISRIS